MPWRRCFVFDTNSTNKLGLSQTKTSCTAKETISDTKREPTEKEKIAAKHVSDKRLISNKCKTLIQLDGQTKTQPNFTMGQKHLNVFFRRQTHGQHMHEKVLGITNHQGDEIQTTNHLTPARRAGTSKSEVRGWGKGNPRALEVLPQPGAAGVGSSTEGPPKAGHRTAVGPSDPTSGCASGGSGTPVSEVPALCTAAETGTVSVCGWTHT